MLILISGCAPAPYVKPSVPAGMPGIYHRVERGETLWRISKIYNADIEEMSRINHIADNTKIEVGQQIFIPRAQRPQPAPVRYANDDFIWPVKGKVVTGFGQTSHNMINKGINIQPYGTLDIVAARKGRVVFYSDNFGVFGKTIIIEHADGLSTVYARNAQVFIKPGETVQKGACIAKAGSAGRDGSTYLHFEIRKGYTPVNPLHYLP
ncbi:MAG: hypothetical protein A3K83_07165 [Omnitrophica WOR_2 bacterium RBG_13_44_8b]|nr:MAG: hypothetical protein A3K83_07165 [Omnitrophica WOR_2 bacterium RBG_13_44_8b]